VEAERAISGNLYRQEPAGRGGGENEDRVHVVHEATLGGDLAAIVYALYPGERHARREPELRR
jgi:hypothetical protein